MISVCIYTNHSLSLAVIEVTNNIYCHSDNKDYTVDTYLDLLWPLTQLIKKYCCGNQLIMAAEVSLLV
jgi:hypothetical protein